VSIYTAGPTPDDVVERVRQAVNAQLEYVNHPLELTIRPVKKGGQHACPGELKSPSVLSLSLSASF